MSDFLITLVHLVVIMAKPDGHESPLSVINRVHSPVILYSGKSRLKLRDTNFTEVLDYSE